MAFRALVPNTLRRMLRRSFDRLFCRRDIAVAKIGLGCPWTVMPSCLGAGVEVLSGGAGHDISFEIELAKKFGCRVAVFDPSPTGAETFAAVREVPNGLTFHSLGLSAETKWVSFAEPSNAAEGSFGVPAGTETTVTFECVSPRDALYRAGLKEIELLKIDIEGFEYEFLEQMLAQGILPAQIAVEFHHFLPHISWWRTRAIISKLKAAGYLLAHKEQCDFLFIHRRVLTT